MKPSVAGAEVVLGVLEVGVEVVVGVVEAGEEVDPI